jgi:hypothetical protein
MKIRQNILLAIIGLFFGTYTQGLAATEILEKKWVVVGAGPAGLVSIGG